MPISIARWRHNIREIAVENCENSKNRRKRMRTTSYRCQKDFNKISPQHFSDENVDVHLYNFSAIRYIALAAIVKLSIGSQKIVGNEQLRAHQKSYRK